MNTTCVSQRSVFVKVCAWVCVHVCVCECICVFLVSFLVIECGLHIVILVWAQKDSFSSSVASGHLNWGH